MTGQDFQIVRTFYSSDIIINMLPREIFEKEISGAEQISKEDDVFYITEKITFINGIEQHLYGAEYPTKGLATPTTLFAINLIKRLFVEGLKISLKFPFSAWIPLFGILPYKYKLKAVTVVLEGFRSVSNRTMETVFLKHQFLLPFSREIYNVVNNFLIFLGVKEEISNYTAKVMAHFVEYDNAYRLRLQDMFHSSSKILLKNAPRKEIKRMADLVCIRGGGNDVGMKFKRIASLLSISLLHPKIKKAFCDAINICDFKKLQFDESDIYWISMRTDYDYLGEGVETRSKRNAGKKMPIPVPKQKYDELMKLSQDGKVSKEELIKAIENL